MAMARNGHDRSSSDVAAVQPYSSPSVEELLRGFDVIPPPAPGGPAIDVDAVRRRRPHAVLIDGLAYENPPGSRHAHRCEDVEDLLAAGISVITSINLHHIKVKSMRVAPEVELEGLDVPQFGLLGYPEDPLPVGAEPAA